ncbi:MAG: hypothetical protein R2824_05155 [Saprospiraceae bacterium]|nr:hypothetical protein [Lewinella sp.]
MSFQQRSDTGGSPMSTITGIIIAVLFFLLLFYLTKIVFTVLWYAAPILFIASLIIDHTVFLGYAKWIGGQLKKNAIVGIGAIVLSALLFPLTALFLLGKALFRKKVKDAQRDYEIRTKGELIDYEVVDEDEMMDEDLRLPPIEQEPRRSSRSTNSEYDDLFR